MLKYLLLISFLFIIAFPSQAQHYELSQQLAEHIIHEQYKKLKPYSSKKLKKYLNGKNKRKLKKSTAFINKIEDYSFNDSTIIQGMKAYLYTIKTSDKFFILNLLFNGDVLGGFYYSTLKYEEAPYISSNSFQKSRIKLKIDTFSLPAEIVYPKGIGPFPAVVLVHGSGSTDKDEEAFAYKPFYDLSHGLAIRGIASIRYDKRSFKYPHLFKEGKQFGVQEETIDDALAAFSYLSRAQLIDPNKIILLGHSLGAYLAPKIIEQQDSFWKSIMIAAPLSPIEDVIYDQSKFYFLEDSSLSLKEKKALRKIDKRRKKIKYSDYTKKTKASKLLGYWPGTWYSQMANYHPDSLIIHSKKDYLLIFGNRDFQVLPKEAALWEKALFNGQNSKIIKFPLLNHMMIEGHGKPNREEYLIPSYIPEYVLDELAEWIMK